MSIYNDLDISRLKSDVRSLQSQVSELQSLIKKINPSLYRDYEEKKKMESEKGIECIKNCCAYFCFFCLAIIVLLVQGFRSC